MFQLLCENQSDEEVLDYINNICLKKDILLKSSKRHKDITILSLFRSILRYLIDKKDVDKAIDIFLIIKDIEPFDIIGSIYYSELLISQKHDPKLIQKGMRILNNIKNYIDYINILSKNDKSHIDDDHVLIEKDKKIFSNELIINILKNNNKIQGNDQNKEQNIKRNEKDEENYNQNDKFDIIIGFEQDTIEKNFNTLYQYMKMNDFIFEDLCYSISSQNHILVSYNNVYIY